MRTWLGTGFKRDARDAFERVRQLSDAFDAVGMVLGANQHSEAGPREDGSHTPGPGDVMGSPGYYYPRGVYLGQAGAAPEGDPSTYP